YPQRTNYGIPLSSTQSILFYLLEGTAQSVRCLRHSTNLMITYHYLCVQLFYALVERLIILLNPLIFVAIQLERLTLISVRLMTIILRKLKTPKMNNSLLKVLDLECFQNF